MRIYGENFIRQAPDLLRRYGLKVLIGGMAVTGVGYAAYTSLWPTASALTHVPAQTSPASAGGLGIKEAQQVRKELDEQKEDAKIRDAFPKLQKTLEGLVTKLTETEQRRQKEQEEGKAKIAALEQQVQAQKAAPAPAKQTPPPPAAPKQAPVVPRQVPPAVPPSVPQLGSRLYLLSPSEKPSRTVKTPRANHLETAHLTAGSFALARLLFGGQASSRERSASPISFAIIGEFTSPYKLQGPGRQPLRTALEIQGCFALGEAGGDMAMSRVLARPTLLSCVFPSGESFEQPIKAALFGKDGRLGIPARVDQHASAAETKAFLTAMLQEVSAALGLARSKVVVTSVTSGPQPFQGMQTQLDRLGQLYIQQMAYLLPTLNADPGELVWIQLEEGVTLEGLPTQTLVRGGEWPTY